MLIALSLSLVTESIQAMSRAILVGIQLPGVNELAHAANLEELGHLVKTLGYEVAGTLSQKRDAIDNRTVLGKGKLDDLAALTDQPQQPDLVVVDHEISPGQIRNLEQATGVKVLDRTGVIMEIFHRHARSREARLQIEIARLKYVAPRLREMSGGERRQGPGSGESDLDLERRGVRDRLAELKRELEDIERETDRRRAARGDRLRVALVGYTNAGKSSLMRSLTGSEVLVADQLFATLDTTVRALVPETTPRVLVTDTVGFIKKLPHDLVASFRSTLAEALEASLLLHVADASDPAYLSQLAVTREVLHEIGAQGVPSRLVLNKVDLVSEKDQAVLREKHPDAVLLSSQSPADVAALRQTIIDFFEAAMVDDHIAVPYAKQALVRDLFETMRVLSQESDATSQIFKVRGLPGAIARLRKLT